LEKDHVLGSSETAANEVASRVLTIEDPWINGRDPWSNFKVSCDNRKEFTTRIATTSVANLSELPVLGASAAADQIDVPSSDVPFESSARMCVIGKARSIANISSA